MACQIRDWKHYQKRSWETISCLICGSVFTFPRLSKTILKKKGLHKIVIYNNDHINEIEGWVCKNCYKKLKANAKG